MVAGRTDGAELVLLLPADGGVQFVLLALVLLLQLRLQRENTRLLEVLETEDVTSRLGGSSAHGKLTADVYLFIYVCDSFTVVLEIPVSRARIGIQSRRHDISVIMAFAF